MDQVHEAHLARILENRSRRGVLGVYTSDVSKRLYDAAQRQSAATASTQTRPPPPPPPQQSASGVEGVTSPSRPFRYPPSGHGTMPSPNSLFETILDHSTADLYSEEGAAPSPSVLLNDAARSADHWEETPASDLAYDSHRANGMAMNTEPPRGKVTAPSSGWSALKGPGWQRASPLNQEDADASSAPRWRTAAQTARAQPPYTRQAAPPQDGATAERVPLFSYRGSSGAPRPDVPSPSSYAADSAAPASARARSSPRGFSSFFGLLQTPRWREAERAPSVAAATAAEPSRWRAPSSSSPTFHNSRQTMNTGAYPSYAPARPYSFDPHRASWLSSTLQESYPLPIAREEYEGVTGWHRGGPSVDSHRRSFPPSGAEQCGAWAGVAETVRWTDERGPALRDTAARASRQSLHGATRSRSSRHRRHDRASSRSASLSSSPSSRTESSLSTDESASSYASDRGRARRRGGRRRGRALPSSRRDRSTHTDRKSRHRHACRQSHRDGRGDTSANSLSESALSGQTGTQAPSEDGWTNRTMGRAASLNPAAASTVVYTGDRENGGGRAFPVSRNQPPRHPPRVRSFYEEAPIGLPDVRSTIDTRTSVQVLMAGDWFFKWDRKGTAVHQRWIWVDVKSYLLVWSRKETHDSLFSGSVPLETISQVTPRELVQADADGLPRNYYVLMIETTRRVLQIATERKEKADVWYEALNNVVAFVRRREMNKGALIPD